MESKVVNSGDEHNIRLYSSSHQRFIHSAQSNHLFREWQSKGTTNHSPNDFILPLFIIPECDSQEEITSMPNVCRYGVNKAIEYLKPLVSEYSLKSVLLFPVMREKGFAKAINEQFNPVIKLIPKLKNNFPSLTVITDVCLCGFTEDGHCCVFNENGKMDNSESISLLSKLSVSYAKAGADMIAPSDMMDCRVDAIRKGLNENGFHEVSIMSYSAKFASCFYGPFRDAAGSAPKFGDRKCYQLPPGSAGLAMRAVKRDIEEGADVVMVKPGLPYLDLVQKISSTYPEAPVAVYHVSGEYAMLCHGATAGAFVLKTAVMEVVTSFKRAGASIVITYFTPLILKWLKDA
ncbi:delta-aminolevulinic acid dehydratase-like protein [Leptotrombidium deliense]|uniref:Delta-aminolevulinic acid dehydratase n=1 Tax=Leptotrombidium deliense TaxID=299467 RepID=A0A443SIV6_9ACAR|nr:delta-aminolevulinic acid dehydratase-like protein [Leptotrombidium deliense]